MWMALVLPAPLGPSSPNTSPRRMPRSKLRTAALGGLPSCGRIAAEVKTMIGGLKGLECHNRGARPVTSDNMCNMALHWTCSACMSLPQRCSRAV